MESLESFRARARAWLEANAELKPARTTWGEGSDSVALFQHLTRDAERRCIDDARSWIARKIDAGFGAISWEVRWGGLGLPPAYADAFAEEEKAFVLPLRHEAVTITTALIAPTVRAVGTEEQQERFLRRMLRTDDMWCQLFSEPDAGSDLASVCTMAVREGDEWVLNGQKVWTSGAQFADWGFAICRTDRTVPKHQGMTAFAIPMSAAGVTVRPLRQLTGGSSFNEVFLNDVRIPDDNRIDEVGLGWKVALTTLGFERGISLGEDGMQTVHRLFGTARQLDRNQDPLVRQALARAYIHQRVVDLTKERAQARNLAAPGPEGSIGKLLWTNGLRRVTEAASLVLGPRLAADCGEWGTYAWADHVLGTAGCRLAGGTDEIQRRILADRVLGLPSEPR